MNSAIHKKKNKLVHSFKVLSQNVLVRKNIKITEHMQGIGFCFSVLSNGWRRVQVHLPQIQLNFSERSSAIRPPQRDKIL
jgi:hypothetical protein